MSKRRKLFFAAAMLASVIASYFLWFEEWSFWRDPMAMRGVKRLWMHSRDGGLDEHEIGSVRLILEHHKASRGPGWKQRAVRTVVAVVVEYPDSFNAPQRGADLAIQPRGSADFVSRSMVLRDFARNSQWAKWADENWNTIEQWLTANIDNLKVSEEGDRFVLSTD